MNHVETIKVYQDMFGVALEIISEWFPNGKNSVRIRFKDRRCVEIVFTYRNNENWRLETVKQYLDHLGDEQALARHIKMEMALEKVIRNLKGEK